jgi:hypothetical protein
VSELLGRSRISAWLSGVHPRHQAGAPQPSRQTIDHSLIVRRIAQYDLGWLARASAAVRRVPARDIALGSWPVGELPVDRAE